ncbi:MAG: hypothetical protein R3D44_00925 [Hyphomicrobiaceae bacterium]
MRFEPLPYHLAVADCLAETEPELWHWFEDEHNAARDATATLSDLRRFTVRIERSGADEPRYALAEAARDRIQLAEPIALYRLLDPAEAPGISLVFLPEEIAIVLAGAILDHLRADGELLAAFGREIARFALFRSDNGRLHVAERALRWLAAQKASSPEIRETARRYWLVTEAYCDAGGLIASDDFPATLTTIFKLFPGADAADVAPYLAPSDSDMVPAAAAARSAVPSDLDARARALARFQERSRSRQSAILEDVPAGAIDLGTLDLTDQKLLRDMTRSILDRVLCGRGMHSAAVLAYAREMFTGYEPPATAQPLTPPPRALSPSIVDYLAYLLLDLATAEGSRLQSWIAVAVAAADEVGVGPRFREIARQELRGRRGVQAGLAGRAA